MEVRSCLSLLKDTPSVVDKATSLLDSLMQPVPEAAPQQLLQPISPLHPRTATISRIELNQRPLLQQLADRAPPGTDFLSLLLFLLADDSTHAFAYRAVECLDDLLNEGGAVRRA